jgi:hypothetical protein
MHACFFDYMYILDKLYCNLNLLCGLLFLGCGMSLETMHELVCCHVEVLDCINLTLVASYCVLLNHLLRRAKFAPSFKPHKGCAAMVVRMSRMGCAVAAWMLQKGSPEATSCAVAGPGQIGERRPDPVGRSPILALPAWWLGGRVCRGDAR